jgi:niacin transporter
MGIILCALLPFVHDIITTETGALQFWVPNLGIVEALTGSDGLFLGYSAYRIFLALVGMQLSSFIAWFLVLEFSKGKSYRFVFLFPTVINGYQLLLMVFNLRKTVLNGWNYKIFILLLVGVLLILNFYLTDKNAKNLPKN